MRHSPRKRSGASSCSTPVEIFSFQQLNTIPLGELRHLASEKHGIKNAVVLKKPELLSKLKEHFESRHGQELNDEKEEVVAELSPISQTIDKLRSRIKDKSSGGARTDDAENTAAAEEDNVVGSADRLLELAEHALTTQPNLQTSQDHQAVTYSTDTLSTETILPEDDGIHVVQTTGQEQSTFDPSSDVINEEVIGNSEENLYEEFITTETVEIVQSGDIIEEIIEDDEEDEVTSSTHNLQAKYNQKVCHGYVVAGSVKELRDLGRDMLRIHAENHGIEHASRLRMPELLKVVIEHYNNGHNAGLELSRLEMLKLNMLKLKKVKVAVRDKTPPPDFSKIVPKNVVPLEEQVHHVYEKRPDVCTVDIIVNNLKDMLALGTSILRPEASKHRVANSSRKQKLQVVEELWEHYLKFHLKETEGSEVVEEEYENEPGFEGFRDSQRGFIVVREEDIVQGEEIQAIAEEIAE